MPCTITDAPAFPKTTPVLHRPILLNAVGWYPVPSGSDDKEFSPLTAVHVATAVDTFAQTGMYAFDRDYMERLHLGEKAEAWCASLPAQDLAA